MIDDFYQAALAALRHHLDTAGATYQIDDGEVCLGGHRLGLSITFEGFVPQGDLTLAPLDIQIHLDGDSGDRFRVGTLGVGPDRAAAMRDAISEWHLLAAAPLLAALGAAVEKRRADTEFKELAGWELFAGRVGIRGEVPAQLRTGGAFYRSMLGRLQQIVAGWDKPNRRELRSIFFMASRGPDGCEIQAAVDGIVSQPLAELLAGLSWPSGKGAYLYKQLFVLAAGTDR